MVWGFEPRVDETERALCRGPPTSTHQNRDLAPLAEKLTKGTPRPRNLEARILHPRRSAEQQWKDIQKKKKQPFERNLLLGEPFCGVPCEFQSTAAAFLGGPNMSPQHEIRLQGSREPLALHELFPEGTRFVGLF